MSDLRLACSLAFALSVAALFPHAAHAQPVRPNVLVIFDTSGSMLVSNRYDGSPLCSDMGQNSNIFRLKQAMREALAEIGTDEANFGLARFPQLENPTLTPACGTGQATGAVGHYYTDATTAVQVGTELRESCRISGHTTDQETYGPWFDGSFRQSIIVDVTKRPAGLKPLAADFDPPGANIAEIYKWIDNREDADNVPPIADPELRGRHQWWTPLGRSLFYARMYFDNFVKPADPRAACRQNVVILVTDGAETCDEAAGTGIDLMNCSLMGTWDPLNPRVQACKLLRESNIRTYVVTESSAGNANDLIAAAGGTNRAVRVSLTNTAQVKAALIGIIAETVPPAETCNGKDDDCDGKVDELPLPGVGGPCSCPGLMDAQVGKGICKGGNTVCKAGQIVCEGCTLPRMEVCNGLDDNCNGLIDDGVPGVGNACACGMESEATLMKGECRLGKLVCKGTEPLTCEGCQTPKQETCDCKDNNCNGETDEGNPCSAGFTCVKRDNQCRCELLCKAGEFPCPNGYYCDTMATPRVCVSAKCAGKVCPDGFACDEGDGQCKDKCAGVRCATNEKCVNGLCLNCYALGCPTGQVCRDARCVSNPCHNVSCAGDEFCDEIGNCVKARCTPACFPEEKCWKGQCMADPCVDLNCGAGEFCDPLGPRCKTDVCALKSCQPGQKCVQTTGECVDDPCRTIVCPNSCYQCQLDAQGRGQCVALKECLPDRKTIQARGGGCSCELGRQTREGTGLVLVVMALLLARGRRRRRGQAANEASRASRSF